MISPPATEKLLSLRECAKQLADDVWLGSRSPAYITLKRWAKHNLLKTARVMKPGVHHPLYRMSELARIAKERHGSDTPAGAPAAHAHSGPVLQITPPRPETPFPRAAIPEVPKIAPSLLDEEGADPQTVVSTLVQISRTLIEIRNSLASRSEQEDLMINGLKNLDTTRKMLMTKYDSESTGMRNRIDALAAENAELKTKASPVDVAKLNLTLTRLSEQVAGLAR